MAHLGNGGELVTERCEGNAENKAPPDTSTVKLLYLRLGEHHRRVGGKTIGAKD